MNRKKCSRCGLVNSTADEMCRRCGASLADQPEPESGEVDSEVVAPKRGIVRRLAWMLGTAFILLFASYLSLLATSDPLGYDRRKTVGDAVMILEQQGFGKEAFALRNLVAYRETDNWWNRYVGHHDAYAATNFPFEIVTLYPEFFEKTIDDNERAAILLHEACHLFGSGEDSALEKVWRDKQRLGWTSDKYSSISEAWNNTRRLTVNRIPELFKCGADGQADCY
jgi:hypothetical protein